MKKNACDGTQELQKPGVKSLKRRYIHGARGRQGIVNTPRCAGCTVADCFSRVCIAQRLARADCREQGLMTKVLTAQVLHLWQLRTRSGRMR